MAGDEILTRWQAIVAERDAEAAKHWDDRPSPYFLHAFRPDGAGLAPLFEGMPAGDEVHARLLKVFVAGGSEEGGHAYFVPSSPPAATADELANWATRHLAAMGAIAEVLDERGAEVRALIDGALTVEVVAGLAPDEESGEPHPMVARIYELTTEYGSSLEDPTPHGDYLLDPLYYLACDYALAYWVLWPYLRGGATIDDPFASHFELWRHGAKLSFGAGTVRVHAPKVRGKLAAKRSSDVDRSDLEAIEAAWRRIEDAGATTRAELRRGASVSDLDELAVALGRAVPASLRASLARHDGTVGPCERFGDLQLLPVHQIADAWRTYCANGPAHWIPMAMEEPRMLCVDPTGCVIETDVYFEEPPRKIAASLSAWLDGAAGPTESATPDPVRELLAQMVEAGHLELSDDADPGELVPIVVDALRAGRNNEERGRKVSAALMDSPLVQEVYVDEAQMSVLLARLR